MVKITKVYTKRGDKGETDLAGGKRVKKTHPRIIAVGEIDELNATLGFAKAAAVKEEALKALVSKCERIQRELFNLVAQLVVLKEDRRGNTPLIESKMITQLETEIDEMNADLPSLSSFILPGGGEIASRFHLARTLCRRAERALLVLSEMEDLDGEELPYINRLSDWFFVVSRYVSTRLKQEELLWS